MRSQKWFSFNTKTCWFSISWLTMALHSRQLFHESACNGFQCRNESVNKSVGTNLSTAVCLLAALLQTALTLADLGHLHMQSSLWHCRQPCSIYFFHFLAFYPFLPFSHVCLETTAGFLLAVRILNLFVLFLEDGLEKNCLLPRFLLYFCCWLEAWWFLVDGFCDSVMNLLPPCS